MSALLDRPLTRRAVWLTTCLAGAALSAAACARVGGSGNIVSTPISVGTFSRLEVGSAFDVTVSTGSPSAVTLQIDDNLVSRVDIGVSGDTLHIRLKRGISVHDATLKADVTASGLTAVELSGAARVHLPTDFQASDLNATESGASRLDGRVRGHQLKLSLSGASVATLSGNVARLIVEGSGASQLAALDLQTTDLEVSLSGASQATVSASGTISAEVSGASTLRYRGSPRFTKKEISGASTIEQV